MEGGVGGKSKVGFVGSDLDSEAFRFMLTVQRQIGSADRCDLQLDELMP